MDMWHNFVLFTTIVKSIFYAETPLGMHLHGGAYLIERVVWWLLLTFQFQELSLIRPNIILNNCGGKYE